MASKLVLPFRFPEATEAQLKQKGVKPEDDDTFKAGWDQQIQVLAKDMFDKFEESDNSKFLAGKYVVDEASEDTNGSSATRYVVLVDADIVSKWKKFTSTCAYDQLVETSLADQTGSFEKLQALWMHEQKKMGLTSGGLTRFEKSKQKCGEHQCTSYEMWRANDWSGTYSYKYLSDGTVEQRDGHPVIVYSSDVCALLASGIGEQNSHKGISLMPGPSMAKVTVVPARTKDTKGNDKKTQDIEVKYWQAAAEINNGECDFIYKVKGGKAGHSSTDPEKADPGYWEKIAIKTSVHKEKPENSAGLSAPDAMAVKEEWGENMLTPKNMIPPWQKLLMQFTGFFSLLLEGGGTLCFVAYGVSPTSPENLYLGVVLWIVVTVTCIFSFMQEQSADDMMQKFKEMGGAKNIVRRNEGTGFKEEEVLSTDIVPGDVVVLRHGDKISADFRVLHTPGDFGVKEASITGEADMIVKTNQTERIRKLWGDAGILGSELASGGDPGVQILQAHSDGLKYVKDDPNGLPLPNAIRCKNICMCGTDIAVGKATVLCVATGDWTVMGLLYEMTSNDEDDDDTPLGKEIHRFVLIISAIACFLGLLFLIISLVLGLTPINTIVFTIGIIVANVPEGLLATVTVSLTLTAERMKDVQVLVKNLESVETLGSTAVICSDKTGTLTQNKMTVVYGWTPSLGADGEVGGTWWDTAPPSGDSSAMKAAVNPWGDFGDKYALNQMTKDVCDHTDPTGVQLRQLLQVAACCSSAKWDDKNKVDPRNGKIIRAFKDMKPWEKGATGDASEQALLKFCEARMTDGVVNYRQQYEDVGAGGTISFDSKNKWMAQTKWIPGDAEGSKRARIFFKGGADRVMECVESVQVPRVNLSKRKTGSWVPEEDLGPAGKKAKPFIKPMLDERWADELNMVMALMAQQGLRLFGLGYADVPDSKSSDSETFLSNNKERPDSLANMLRTPDGEDLWDTKDNTKECRKPEFSRHWKNPYNKGGAGYSVSKDVKDLNWVTNKNDDGSPKYEPHEMSLTLVGILAIQDPPRHGVPEAVTTCKDASIKVVMVTGDNPDTGAAIAKQIGILWGTTLEELVTLAQLVGPEPADRERALGKKETPVCRLFDMEKTNEYGKSGPRLLPGVPIKEQINQIRIGLGGKFNSNWTDAFRKECVKKLEDNEVKREVHERLRTSRAVSGGKELDKWDSKKYTVDWWNAFDYVFNPGKCGLVFARTSPIQKKYIVQHFMMAHTKPIDWDSCLAENPSPIDCGNVHAKPILTQDQVITAVTGDGVNDAPALKSARIGICMGIAGTDVTKEAADMILMDDNFASIVRGVKEGRLVFDNLKKSIAYTLSSNIPEISPFICFILVGMPLPLSTVLILCVDLGTDMVPAISLAYENSERDIMERKPRTSEDNLVTGRLISFSYFQIGIIQALAGFYTFMAVMYSEGIPPNKLPYHGELQGFFGGDKGEIAAYGQPVGGFSVLENITAQQKAQTAFFISIICVQWTDILICKTRKLSLFQQGMKNDILNFGLFFETTLGIFLVYTPVIRAVFGIKRLRFIYWLPGIPFAMLILSYDETRKAIMRTQDSAVDFIKHCQRETGGRFDLNLFWSGETVQQADRCFDPRFGPPKDKAKQKLREDILNYSPSLMERIAQWVEKYTYW